MVGLGGLDNAWIDHPWINERLGEHVPERFRPDILLAAATVLGARPSARIVKAQVVAAAADGLRLGWRLERRAPPLCQVGFGGNYLQAPGVMALQRTTGHGADDEDKPPEAQEVHHAAIFPQWCSNGKLRAGC